MNSFFVRLPWDTISFNSTTEAFAPVTRFVKAPIGQIRAKMEMRIRWGGALVVPAFQVANDTLNPLTTDAAAIPIKNDAGAGFANADGSYPFSASAPFTLPTGDKEWIRFGWMVKLASGSNGSARVSAMIEVLY